MTTSSTKGKSKEILARGGRGGGGGASLTSSQVQLHKRNRWRRCTWRPWSRWTRTTKAAGAGGRRYWRESKLIKFTKFDHHSRVGRRRRPSPFRITQRGGKCRSCRPPAPFQGPACICINPHVVSRDGAIDSLRLWCPKCYSFEKIMPLATAGERDRERRDGWMERPPPIRSDLKPNGRL